MFSVSFFCVVSGSSDMRACRADNESVRKTAFLGFSSNEMMVSGDNDFGFSDDDDGDSDDKDACDSHLGSRR